MSELNSDENAAKTARPLSVKNQQMGSGIANPFEKKIIAVAGQKKKKEVIQIQDSEEDRQAILNQDAPKDKSSSNERARQLKKYKKNTLKCNLCKSSGKKSEMRMCLQCRSFFHISCLQQEREATSRYICQKCRFNKQEEIREAQMKKKLQRKTMTIQLEKMSQKKIQKERKKVQISKKVAAFSQRYPYYFVEDRIRFPIQDKLLFIYRQLFQFNENNKIIPTRHPSIPSHMLGDLLQIENFFSTFKTQLENYTELITDLRKTILYVVMVLIQLLQNSNGYDFAFSNMLYCLIKIYLADIFDKNKTDNVKILNEHCFFTILNILNENEDLTEQFVIVAAQQIFRYLSTIPSMKKAFQNFRFPHRFNMQTKIGIIVHLIKGLSQIDQFHGLVSIKSEKMQQYTKQKGQLITQLKKDQAQSLCNNEKLKEISVAQKEMQQNSEGVTRQISKEIQKHKKKMQKLAYQQSKSQQLIKQIKGKIAEIGRAMPFLTSQIIFLGLDRNNSEYFFYCNEPNRLYVKYHNYLLDDSEDFLLYQGKQSIIELVKTLNNKGTHQRHLIDNITSLIKDQIITNVDVSHQISEEYSAMIMNTESKYMDITRQTVVKLIRQTEETFATYLTIRNFQWAAPTVRQVFMQNFKSLQNIQQIKENIKTLQEYFLFVEHISSNSSLEIPENRQNYQESDEQINKTPDGGNFIATKKKIPIRIWGINSEKIKKYWIEYLEECIDLKGLWICAYVFKNNVDKYVKKKMESIYQQQQKEERLSKMNKEKEKEKLQKRKLRSKKQDRSDDRSRSRQRERDRDRDRQYKERSREEPRQRRSQNSSQEDQDEEKVIYKRPNLRQRKKKKKMNIDSDISAESEQENERKQAYQPEPIDISDRQKSQSDNEDACAQCQGYGDMICCDTCPKVYHVDCLGIKEVPQGQWSCYRCLEKLSNQRQTRSRVKKLSNKYPQ